MESKGPRVLIVDDEAPIRRMLKISLDGHGFEIDEAVTGEGAVLRAAVFKPDLILLDLGLPDIDGKDVIKQIRDWSTVPIIILTARDQETEKIEALDAGADDYVTKPFSMGELLARMRVAIRRSVHVDTNPIIKCGDVTIDLSHRRVTRAAEEVRLTPTEYELLKTLATHMGKVLTHKQLLKTVWGNAYQNDTQYLRVYINQLRRKVEDNPTQPRYIITESGVGYRMMQP
ncbi:MAG TPA: DNA-binding response regulator [Firmicutes bacterium]|nr:DNA-binding response regulator [Bacillota bacterium]